MPSTITHQLIAEDARERFPAPAKEISERAKDEFFLGAQGPDFLFFYRIGCRSEYNFGKYLHRNRVFDVFCYLLEYLGGLSGGERDFLLAYALGYICHNATDAAFHPFVYRFMEENRLEKREHQQMENDWDVYFLRERRGMSAEKYNFGFSPKVLNEHGAVERWYEHLARKLGREEVTPAAFRRGVKRFSAYLSFFHGKCYSAQRGWERTEEFFHIKKYLSRLYPREAPDPRYLGGDGFFECSEGRGSSADELYDLAVEESVRLVGIFLRAAEEGGQLPYEDFSKGFLTGKPLE